MIREKIKLIGENTNKFEYKRGRDAIFLRHEKSPTILFEYDNLSLHFHRGEPYEDFEIKLFIVPISSYEKRPFKLSKEEYEYLFKQFNCEKILKKFDEEDKLTKEEFEKNLKENQLKAINFNKNKGKDE